MVFDLVHMSIVGPSAGGRLGDTWELSETSAGVASVIGEHSIDVAPRDRSRFKRRRARGPRRARSAPSTAPSRGHATRCRRSTPRAARNASRLAPDSSVQAITTSQAGSPTPELPKSITAPSRPPRRSRFPMATSPWNQTGSRSQVVAIASSHTRRGRFAGDLVAERLDRAEGFVRVGRERAAAIEVVAVRAPGRPAASTSPQRDEERRQRASRTRSGRRCRARVAISPSSQR